MELFPDGASFQLFLFSSCWTIIDVYYFYVLYTWKINDDVLKFPSVEDLVSFFESLVGSIPRCQINTTDWR